MYNFQSEVSKIEYASRKIFKKGSSEYLYKIWLSLLFLKFATEKAEMDFYSKKQTYDQYLKYGKNEDFLVIEKEYFWNNIKKTPKDEKLQIIDKAFESLTKFQINFKNIQLYYFSSENKVTSNDIEGYIEILENNINISKENFGDLFGAIYERFIGKYSSDAKRGGQFYTPHSVVELMVNITECSLTGKNELKIYDPTVGTGGMLLRSLCFLKRNKIIDLSKVQFFGQELNENTWKIAKMNLLLREEMHFDLGKKPEDVFSEDLFENKKFDCILSNPPFNDPFSEETYGNLLHDKRWIYKPVFGEKQGNYMFFQHIISHLKKDGVAAVVMSIAAGVNNQKDEIFIRKKMIKDNLIDGLIALPKGVFSNATIASSIWIFNKSKKNDNVIFVDLRDEIIKERKNKYFSKETIEDCKNIFFNFRNNKTIDTKIPYKILTNNKILEKDIFLKIDPSNIFLKEEKTLTKEEAIEELKNIEKNIQEIQKNIKEILKEFN